MILIGRGLDLGKKLWRESREPAAVSGELNSENGVKAKEAAKIRAECELRSGRRECQSFGSKRKDPWSGDGSGDSLCGFEGADKNSIAMLSKGRREPV